MLEDYIVVDLEMTGLNAKNDRILEIGAVKVKAKRIEQTFSKLIRPERKLSETVIALTGITDEIAAGGDEMDAAVSAFLEFAGDLVWVGHNILFDYKFIRQWEANHCIKRTCYAVDTLKIARKFLGDLEHKSLDFLCGHFGIAREVSHRALADAAATQTLYEVLEQNFLEKEPERFAPYQLQYKVRRQTPATKRQIAYLKRLLEYHKLEPEMPFEQMNRSYASSITDRIVHRYGGIAKKK